MGFSVGFVIGLVGVLILSHAAYSTSQYRGLLKITEDEFSGPPFNVVVELIVGLVLCMWAALTVPGDFLSIHPHSDENRWLMHGIWINILIKQKSFHWKAERNEPRLQNFEVI
ncbi:hypothetical protein OIU85_016606 [Salix viminalis]|uniref:Membrane magnesium transporter n=1 Tax=Salix viminalis TaxID=40686 RepID=A0A9Q0ZQ04_SALVM|nr:hypothetical protein OIU85_016606 [Salix viminalis]